MQIVLGHLRVLKKKKNYKIKTITRIDFIKYISPSIYYIPRGASKYAADGKILDLSSWSLGWNWEIMYSYK